LLTPCICGLRFCCNYVSDIRPPGVLDTVSVKGWIGPLTPPTACSSPADNLTAHTWLLSECLKTMISPLTAFSFLVSDEPMCMQARFLLAKLNPSATHQSDQGLTSEIIFTEDVSLHVSTKQHQSPCLFCCIPNSDIAKLSTCLLFAMLLTCMTGPNPDKRRYMSMKLPTYTVTYICC